MNIFSQWAMFSRGQKRFLTAWIAFLIGGSALTLILMGGEQYRLRQESSAVQAFHLASARYQHESTGAETTPPPGHEKDVPRLVKVGIYLDRVPELSIISSHWKADFNIWFNWEGSELNPGETFHVTNGEILTKNLIEKSDDGDSHYALYRVTTQMSKAFDVARFPRNDHLLTIDIEDGSLQSYQLRYVADTDASDASPRVVIPGFKVINKQASVRPYTYQTTRGNPKLAQGYKATYSQFDYAIWIARPTWSLHLKMFVVMFGAVFIALLGFFVASSSDRLVLVSGSLFAAVANMYIASTLIPDTGTDTLADHVNWIGAAFIMVAIVQAVIHQHSFEGREDRREASRFFDLISFVLMVPLYVLLNAAIPLLASI